VRAAVNYAIDKEGIVKGVYRGRGKPAPYGFFSPITNGYNATHEQWKYDPAKAKALLTEAGHGSGFTLPDMLVSELSQFPLAPALIEAVNNNLRDVGIRAPLRPIEYGAYITEVRDLKIFSLTYMASNNLADLALGLPVWMRSGSQFSAIKDPAVDAAIVSQASELDPAKRTAILQGLFKTLNATPWAAFTVSPDSYLASTDKVSDLPQPKASAYIQNLHLVSKSS
jgi:ABC-type transport system substrate-binding protein